MHILPVGAGFPGLPALSEVEGSGVEGSRLITSLIVWALLASPAAGQAARSTLRVNVVDQTGAAIVAAAVRVRPASGTPSDLASDGQGQAIFDALSPGPVQVHVETSGFAPYDAQVTLRRGNNTHTATLRIATLEEEIVVSDREVADRQNNGFNTTLTEEDLADLPDDPDEFEAALQQMAGGDAVFQINGFRGGRLPPKNQIRQIRFRWNSFSAENHDAGRVHIDIVTKPGLTAWSGRANLGLRDDVLNARNAFARERTPEQFRRVSANFSGPVRKQKTSLRMEVEADNSYDSRTIVAQLSEGLFADQVRRPVDQTDFGVELEHALTANNTLRFEYQREDQKRANLGVGDFDLPERAYTRDVGEHVFRAAATTVLGKSALNNFRFEFSVEDSASRSLSTDPAIVVIDAFRRGGSGVSNSRDLRAIELSNNLDFTVGKHAMHAGLLLEGGAYRQMDGRNANGTFTFASLEAFLAGRPNTFTQRLGEVETAFSQYELGLFWQDDLRLNKNLSLSVGVREELQSHVDDWLNIMPRVGFTWNPFGAKTALRGGYGIFYDWFGADLYDQSLRVNGVAQRDLLVLNPGYPDPFAGSLAVALPGGRVQIDPGLEMPYVHQVSLGVERPINESLMLQAMYMRHRGDNQLRSRNVNAPDASGVRPFPQIGTITQIESTGRSELDRLTLNANFRLPQRRMMVGFHYLWSDVKNHADSPLSLPADSNNPDAEWGPAQQDVRHRIMTMINVGLPKGIRANVMSQANSPMPYTLTTGRDDNGDGVSNDRPFGVGRNTARGAWRWDMNVRLSRGFGFGGERGGEGGGAIIQRREGGDRGGGGPMIMTVDQSNQRFRVEFYVQAYNILNRTNYMNFSGNLQSPFFGRPSSAGPARRVEVGMQFAF
jgi:hypothetical protein